MTRVAMLLGWIAIGCGGAAATTPPPTPPPAPTTDPNARGADAPPPPPSTPSAGPVEFNSKEAPALRCGPIDSYKYVADEFKCANGSNPFAGNWKAAQASRVGNVGANSMGHIIDLYEVPCPEGAKHVYVDMYGCDKGSGGKI